MTATTKTTTIPTLRDAVHVAGLVAASAAAVTLTLVPHQAAAADHGTADSKATTASEQKGGGGQGGKPASTPERMSETERAAESTGRSAAESEQQLGRGARYTADGELITLKKADQPKPKPADDEDLDRWIKQALKVMDKHDIPGSYEGIHSNLIRESSGDPLTINMWDTNAHENIPSKGLLQVIDPTFEAYHVPGTSKDIFDPVANIAAACNYAADRYGSMDNVDSAY
ncbi:transglycosylase SLT domain-containing protein [Streptomyces sp. 4N509B]|uniref:transglycosylase SLT domain-containing protein n=1 Tax=Streptomyces sp. 4N509B TaxID=3457413 RepID=UPI003FD0D55A